MVEELDAREFDAEEDTAGEVTPVLFWADWCGFCARFKPHFEDAAEGSSRRFLSVDISDESSPAWDRYNVEVVPTVILFEDGKEVDRIGGILGEEHLDALLSEHVSA